VSTFLVFTAKDAGQRLIVHRCHSYQRQIAPRMAFNAAIFLLAC